MLKNWIFILFIMGNFKSGFGSSAEPDPVRLILGQVSYIGTDYTAAVKDGEVINEDEYREMIEFSETVIRQFASVKNKINPDDAELIQEQLQKLNTLITQKGSESLIADLSQDLARQIALKFEIPVAPDSHPLITLGHHVYTHHCAVCHGEKGRGDGPGGYNREPPPRDFFDEEVMNVSSPFKFYNILLTGVEGTDMQGYKTILTEDELWSVSYYLSALRFHDASVPLQVDELHEGWKSIQGANLSHLIDQGLDKTLLASLGDLELKKWLEEALKSTKADAEVRAEVFTLLRKSAPFLNIVPLKKNPEQSGSEPDKVRTGLNSAILKSQSAGKSADNGEFELAESLLLDAYLNGFEGAEKSLAVLNRKFVTDVERLFMDARGYARQKDLPAFKNSHQQLMVTLEHAREAYFNSLSKADSGWGDFISSFVIIVREGLEAFLVVAALLALLSSMGAVGAQRWVHAGWLSALVAGGITFWIFETVLQLSGAAKESVEAVCTGIAAIMLFYTGFWLISQFEHQKWNRFVKEQTKKALSTGRLWGLFSIAFIAVYREAAETVLFYSALYSGAGSPLAVSMGFLTGCALLLCVCWGIIRFNLRLPLRQFFMVTSILMVVISVILAGKTVHEVIEAGFLDPTPVSWMPAIDLLGIYPSLETLSAQFALVSIGGVIAYLLSRKKISGDTAS